ncbi:hypothetical protein HELRODRAFT_69165 [Helobdella robusta]|uniref:RBR-type E3 ubiquitin transferase n=1 Tax=Helobdella robusta TaxID=6412 RepID=T1FZQ3_HELRO|nr:hypothetical protein HELRODRAFT_69165 [Helobdella robusta]ESN94505.1 hypothetical protein HELRODRAFT_69165 [Helobdella robusta]
MDDDNFQSYYEADGEEQEADQLAEYDVESFDYQLLRVEEVERLLNESVEALCKEIDVEPALAKVLLHTQKWMMSDIIREYKLNAKKLLANCRIHPLDKAQPIKLTSNYICPVCMQKCSNENVCSLSCGHIYCNECWQTYFHVQIQSGHSTSIECMGRECDLLVPEDMVMNILTNPNMRDKYQEYMFKDHVKSHPELRFCPGANCVIIVRARVCKAKRVICDCCKTSFCFNCGVDYHAPTDCDTIKKWLTKCADDSETANYISAHTKDCPECHVCIEKNGGCNHMQCSKCKHNFCWMCLGDWKAHGSEYYECSRYRENPNIGNESAHAQAREALKKYLFYFERWENHAQSLKLEEQTLSKIKDRIEEKVMNSSGTWIDWQYLMRATNLLKKCRYTLQYTYPYAYYLEKGPRKQLFEYQQAQLEAEVENLSWKVERAEITDRGELENQMDIAEKRRLILVKDFLEA